jgi:hypothetical protein
MMTAIADAKIGRWMKNPTITIARRQVAIGFSNER